MKTNQTCQVCNHPMKAHKDICDSQGVRDGTHLCCLVPTGKHIMGISVSCSCNTKRMIGPKL